MADKFGDLSCAACSWLLAAAVGLVTMIILLLLGGMGWIASIFLGGVSAGLLGVLFSWIFCTPLQSESATASDDAEEADTEMVAEPAPVASAPSPAPVSQTPPAPEPVSPVEAQKPEFMTAARDDGPDDLKKIKGVGPKLEALLHSLGIFHFDQIAAWTSSEVAWVDDNLTGFKGRVTRDNWVAQAKELAADDNG